MLPKFIIKKLLKDAMKSYAAEHAGKIGVSKADVIKAVMEAGGDMSDVREIMAEGVKLLIPEPHQSRFI